MKTFKFVSLLIAFVFSFSTVKAQTADEIIAKHIEAIGGADNWKKLTSMIQTGSMTVQGTNVDLTITTVNGKGMRQDINVMGMNNYMIVTPTEGWRFFPVQGQQAPEAMTADDVKDGQNQLDLTGSLFDYKAKGHTVEFLGKEDVDGTECYKLKLTQKDGKLETYFIDPSTYYVIKSVSVVKANGQEGEVTTTYSNYQKLPEGIVVPMALSVPLGPGLNADLTVSKVEINKPVDEAIFKVAK